VSGRASALCEFLPRCEEQWERDDHLPLVADVSRLQQGRVVGDAPSYTSGMKTAISIPDDLFQRAEQLAQRLGKSRSQVYREALAEYVLRREPSSVTSALDELVEELGPEVDAWSTEAGRRALERSEW
jgi:predicted transcriptional regulator